MVRAGPGSAARLGGDEFAILLERLDHDHEAIGVARRALGAFAEPFEVAGTPITVSAAVGSRSPRAPSTPPIA